MFNAHHTTAPPVLSRRTLLRGAGVALALPLLEAMMPRSLRAAGAVQGAQSAQKTPRRMIAICTPYGILPQQFFPGDAGRSYTPTPYLELLRDFREQLTVFSGVSHPDVAGGHSSEACFLTAAPQPGTSSFKNSISLDQFAAARIGSLTRFPALTLSTGGTRGLSWTSSGVQIPADDSPARVFARLFLDGTAEEVRGQIRRIRQGQSILDTVAEHARRLNRQVSPGDRRKLDQYATSVRQLETELVRSEEWARTPKPTVNVPPPQDIADKNDLLGRTRLMHDLACLALQTDSTRIITLFVAGVGGVPAIDGVSQGHHALSHHGNRPAALDQVVRIETGQMQELARLIGRLRELTEGDQTLLDRTMVLYGSNLGNSSSHSTRNMPVLLAGGGFRHAGHLAFDTTNNHPLPNLYVSMLQRLGIETDRFASSTGTMRGLEMG